MAILRALMSLAVTAMLIKSGMTANYTVGAPNGGWDTSTNLQSWASSQTFSVGDNLIFVYTGNHDVLEVSKADHDSCQTSNPMQTYMGGNTVIPLASAGKRYFTCGTGGHCSQGMKIEIDTLAASSPPPSSPPPPVSSPSPPPQAQTPPPVSSPSPPPQAQTPPPVSSPSPPPQAQTPPPETAPTMTPPSNSRGRSPSPSADVPNSADPPAPPPPSSATKVNILAGFGAGVCSVIAILMSL